MSDDRKVVVITRREHQGEPERVPGLRYEKCDICGLVWNVSKLRGGHLPYRCPLCCFKVNH